MLKIDELDTIKYLVKCIVDKIYPLRVYLFGSFAVGKNNANSDYDFYVIMPDDTPNNLYSNSSFSIEHLAISPIV